MIREKGDKVNRYILRLPAQPEQLFESFGTSTPEQVQQALKIHEVQIDTTDKLNLNLAGQMDALFLLSQTGSYRAKVLGKLSGATYLDHAIRGLNNDKRKITAEKDREDLAIIELKAKLDKFDTLESFSGTIANLEVRLISLATAEQRIEQIRSLLERVKVLKDSWTLEHAKAELLAPFDQVSKDLSKKFDHRVDKIKAISLLLSKVVSFKQVYLRETKLNELLNPIDLSGINRLVECVPTFKVKSNFAKRFDLNKRELVVMAKVAEESDLDYRKTVELYTRLLKDNGVCPTCNQATNHLCAQ